MGRISDLGKLARDTVYRLRTRARGDFPTGRSQKHSVILERAGREAKRIALRNTGAIVVSVPKSGRTWLRFMLDRLGLHLEYQHPGGRLAVPDSWRGKKIVFLHRDPRDVLVSVWFHEYRREGVSRGALSDFMADPRYGLEPIIRTNLAWKRIADASPAGLVLSYEDLQRDTAGALQRVVRFLRGRSSPERKIEEAVAAGRFDRMREAEISGIGARLYGPALEPADPADENSFKTRRGKIGAWKDYFEAEDVEAAEAMLGRYDYFRLMGG